LTFKGDFTVKDILIKMVKHIGRHNITQYHEGCENNCIENIYIYDEDSDSDDEDGQHSDVKHFMDIKFSNNINGRGFRPKPFPKLNGLVKIK
jgi:hypothetical protein